MNSPIVKISEDQNEITHESGFVSIHSYVPPVFGGFLYLCNGCCYDGLPNCKEAPCSPKERNDTGIGIFIQKDLELTNK